MTVVGRPFHAASVFPEFIKIIIHALAGFYKDPPAERIVNICKESAQKHILGAPDGPVV